MTRHDWTAQFEKVAQRKRRTAADVELPPYRTVVPFDGTRLPDGVRFDAIANAWTRRLFDGDFYVSSPPAGVPSTSLVFVQSRDGNTGTRNPSSLGGGETDKHLIYEGLSRVAADGVLAGARTVGGTSVVLSVWRDEIVALRESLGLPRHPVQIVATLGGFSLDDTLLVNVPALPAIVIGPRAWIERMAGALKERPWVTPIATDDAGDLSRAFRALRSMGLSRVSAIGGRSIACALIDAGLVHDLYLTTSPRAGGEPDTPIYRGSIGGAVVVSKEGTGRETGVIFEHLLVGRTEAGSFSA
jgi:riboflavin biosynthesis pyrimidine reductase